MFFQDDENKNIEFDTNEKKASIFNFEIDIYLA